MKLNPYFRIIRIKNAGMAVLAVLLGIWISDVHHPYASMMFLFIAAIASIGFGNVINDIVDIETDTISHPDRPLPKKELSIKSATILALFLFCIAVISAAFVSIQHTFATLIPLILLTVYSLYLKGTPLLGNVMVALLVAYPLLYGAISGPLFHFIIIPALLAFLLNFSREIIKDIQDVEGDKASGIITSATLSPHILKLIIISNSIVYILIIFLPIYLNQFGTTYLVACLFGAIPIHILRSRLLLFKGPLTHAPLVKISSLYKIEMFFGLAALLLEKISSVFLY